MPVQRDVVRVWTPEPRRNSPIHTAAQILEPGRWAEYDPFLLLMEDWFGHGTFDVHPHRGIETVTYVIEGRLRHYDNRFGNGELGPGDVQWMTAGRGVIHKEDPAEGETVHSLQLWVNLPRAEKMTEPRYQNLRREEMPVRREAGAEVRVFSGSSGDVKAGTLNHVPVTMVEITLEPGATVSQDLPGDYNGFLYVLEGRGTFGANQAEGRQGQVLWLGGAGDAAASEVPVSAREPLRALLYAGRPLREPVVAYGPFVMNTREEIIQALEDYQSGRFA
ncbi:MAG: pirin family protein [Alicyclobacillus sp.]|nr:pirin family protein [Alicyclobacillus sp.]